MGQSLKEIAQALSDTDKKVQLIYAFNGTGKTRLSREFKELVSPKETETEDDVDSSVKILYYNAFTEDLFYWDNDLDADVNRIHFHFRFLVYIFILKDITDYSSIYQ
jgi:hypothetical protein